MEQIIKEYEYQEELEMWRHQMQFCLDGGGYLLMYRLSRTYRGGILKAERPKLIDMHSTYCVLNNDGFRY